MRIAIVGTGHVGLVTGACFAERGHEVLCVDNDERKIQMLLEGRMPFYEPGLAALVKKGRARKRLVFGTSLQKAAQYGPIVFLAVGTPSGPGGASDMTALEAASRQLARHAKGYLLVVEKSTVPARTGEKVKRTLDRESRPGVILDVASNPEFLREGSAVEDALCPDRIVIGVSNKKAERILREVYRGHKAPLIVTDISSAEIIKHASNALLATKISFINAVAHLCEACGADVELVARGVGLDPRIGEAFLKAGLGYGGSCFPKDVDAFYRLSVELGAPMEILQEVQKINREQLGRFLRRVEQELWVLRGKTIAQFGLAFKPDTDDVRESIALGCARALAEAGAKVRAFDPQAMDADRKSVV